MSKKRLYVATFPIGTTGEDVRAAFEACGTVHGVSLVTDRGLGRPRGFGFVEMDTHLASGETNEADNR
jgi:RNA recognition motif-containing protein